jgi:hypothetical protein
MIILEKFINTNYDESDEIEEKYFQSIIENYSEKLEKKFKKLYHKNKRPTLTKMERIYTLCKLAHSLKLKSLSDTITIYRAGDDNLNKSWTINERIAKAFTTDGYASFGLNTPNADKQIFKREIKISDVYLYNLFGDEGEILIIEK